jgi:hypothetical protein
MHRYSQGISFLPAGTERAGFSDSSENLDGYQSDSPSDSPPSGSGDLSSSLPMPSDSTLGEEVTMVGKALQAMALEVLEHSGILKVDKKYFGVHVVPFPDGTVALDLISRCADGLAGKGPTYSVRLTVCHNRSLERIRAGRIGLPTTSRETIE